MQTTMLRQELADWGGNFRYAPASRRRPIRGPGEYCAAVRSFAGVPGEGPDGVDGRLLAVGYCRRGLRAFADDLPAWLGYWQASQPRPRTVGSSYNSDPGTAYDSFLLGLPPADARLAPWARTGRGHGGTARRRALHTVARGTTRRYPGRPLPATLDPPCWVPPGASTRDIQRLATLTSGSLRYLQSADRAGRGLWCGTRLDVEELASLLAEWREYQSWGWSESRTRGRMVRFAKAAEGSGGDPDAIRGGMVVEALQAGAPAEEWSRW